MSDPTHLSIGEVLSLVQEEFPDVTISKIRFLESQGLLDPERTPSGYRKFYEADIHRLRWILRQQRENFLPLKVIKDRLDAGETGGAGDGAGAAGQGGQPVPGDSRMWPAVGHPSPVAAPPADEAVSQDHPHRSAGDDLPQGAEGAGTAADAADVAGAVGDPGEGPAADVTAAHGHRPSLLDSGDTSVSMTVDELARAAGLSARQLGELERYGLIVGDTSASTTVYDDKALLAARTCAAFIERGVEARHLRMYKLAAEREAAFFEQLLLPMLRKRKPELRRQGLAQLGELVALGDTLRALMLREALRDHLDR